MPSPGSAQILGWGGGSAAGVCAAGGQWDGSGVVMPPGPWEGLGVAAWGGKCLGLAVTPPLPWVWDRGTVPPPMRQRDGERLG